jgi:predicted MPP superfamily phosphohydrolase
VNPQLMFMLVPRLLVAIVAAAVAYFVEVTWGVGMFFGLESLGTLAYLWGLGVEPQRLTITNLTVTSPHLPASAKPIRLLHLSDFHVERLTKRETRILDYVQSAQPDLIVITGDYLNASNRCDPEAIDQVRELLANLSAPGGVYAVLGTPCVDLPYIAPLHFQENHIHLLRRGLIDIDLGDDRRLTLLGLDCTHDLEYDSQLFSNLAELAPVDTTSVFLYHSPELMPQVSQRNIDLYLCGHTHGGQLRVPGYGALFTSSVTGKRYEMGRYDEQETTLYVSRGIGLEGFSMPRLRLFCPPEITMVTIQGA